MSLVYLASVYSQGNAGKNKRTRRFKQACKKAADLMAQGEVVFCPIAHSHPIEVHGMDTVEGHDFWLKQDFAILKKCDKLVVYRMKGWDKSVGITAEIEFAKQNNIPIEYID